MSGCSSVQILLNISSLQMSISEKVVDVGPRLKIWNLEREIVSTKEHKDNFRGNKNEEEILISIFIYQ